MNYLKLSKFHLEILFLASVIIQTISVVKSGLEKQLRDKAPHLLNINGDCCHHVHNSVKAFCQTFNNFVENWIDLLHIHNKWSTEIRDGFKKICFLLNIPFRMLPLRISHCWLSLYDSLTVNMFDAFLLLYYR